MSEHETDVKPLALAETFPPVSSDAWDAAVRQDLKGADYDRRLVWRTDEGFSVRPYYRAEDLVPLAAQIASVPGSFPYVRGSGEPFMPAGTDPLPQNAVRADLLHDTGATAVQEVGYAVAEGVDRLASAVSRGTAADGAAREFWFVFAVGSSYFLEIAKLRAARLVWAQAVEAFQPADRSSARMRQFVRTARSNKSVYDPYTNLLRATTEALSAAIGGCDRLLVEPFGFEDHVAANVSRVLAEECHVDAVADPAGGSYYVETLTDAIARAAWALLQQVEEAGGYTQARAGGSIDAAVAASRAAREKAVSARRRTLVGVNNYPDVQAKEPVTVKLAAEPGDAVAASWRMPQPFERIRERTARWARAHGRYPVVLLLTRGDVKMRMARANFCLNFFGCAGFDIVRAADLQGEPDLVVLCSSDPEYLPFAGDVCSRTTAPVIVAGNPKDQIGALQAAGVAGFVHVQSDMVATLTEWQQRLGMGG
jgi:methylmalonyl-CoA mutase